MPASEVFTGARAIFKVEGKTVGYALGCNGSTAINYQPLQVLGHLEVIEHVPTAYIVEMSSNLSRLSRFTRLSQGQSFPGYRESIEGANTSPQIMPAFGDDGRSILQSGTLTAVIFDWIQNKSLYTIKGIKASQKNWDVTAAAAVAENVTYVAQICNEADENVQTLGDVSAAA